MGKVKVNDIRTDGMDIGRLYVCCLDRGDATRHIKELVSHEAHHL